MKRIYRVCVCDMKTLTNHYRQLLYSFLNPVKFNEGQEEFPGVSLQSTELLENLETSCWWDHNGKRF